MAWITLRQLLDDAAENGYGLPAFNVNSLEQCQAILVAAQAVDAPVILQATRVTRAYFEDVMLHRIVQAAVEMHPSIPICLHLDHGSTVAECESAIDHGFSSVMMDGSLQADGRTPSTFQYNCTVTAAATKVAHARGISVEGALGLVGSLQSCMGEPEDDHGAVGRLSREQLLTDPVEAEDLVAATNIDALAVSIGNTHGAHKFDHRPDESDLLLPLIGEIHGRLPNVHLVLHGCSTLPDDLQDIIADHGGERPRAWGMPIEEIQQAMRFGVRKINIDTDGRLAMTGAVRRVLAERRAEYDPRAYLGAARDAMAKLCRDRFEAFGAAGRASRLRPIPLPEMALRYASGSLNSSISSN